MADNDKRKAAKREWINRLRAARREAGLCVGCGGPVEPVTPETPAPVKRGRGRPRSGRYCDICLSQKGDWRAAKIDEIEQRIEDLKRVLES